MTYKLKKNATKKDIDNILKKISQAKGGLDMSKFIGKVKSFDKIDNIAEWQRRQRDDGTYSY
jgi:hypothetical protein